MRETRRKRIIRKNRLIRGIAFATRDSFFKTYQIYRIYAKKAEKVGERLDKLKPSNRLADDRQTKIVL